MVSSLQARVVQIGLGRLFSCRLQGQVHPSVYRHTRRIDPRYTKIVSSAYLKSVCDFGLDLGFRVFGTKP
jgi:hypothetical protein